VRTIANISDNFRPGETYNIGGDQYHSIEELSNIILEVTGADPKLVEYRDTETLTTRNKRVDISKAIRDLKHVTTVSLRDGVAQTVAWMRKAYDFPR
jgi:dTDP-glucose 4,6-dehydratase